MPSKKKQHYVPQFHLRRFSINSSGKALNLFNKPSKKIIRRARLKDQAYKNYFYGKDFKVENSLQIFENKAAKVISKIVNEEELPIRASKEHNRLLTFTIFQSARTLYMADQMNEMADKFMKNIFQHDPQLEDKMNGVKIGIHDPVRLSLAIAATLYPLVCDLDFKFLKNKTEIPFITSDHPVILYNQLMEKVRHFNPHTGLVCKGLQIFLPLAPSITMIFYDEAVYRIGRGRDRLIDIEDNYSIKRLNELQFINAYENVFFGDNINDNYIETLSKECIKQNPIKEVQIQEFFPEKIEGDSFCSLLMTQQPTIRIGFKISPISFTLKGRRFRSGNKAVYVRDEVMCDLHDKFMELAKKGVYKHSEFYRFLSDLEEQKNNS